MFSNHRYHRKERRKGRPPASVQLALVGSLVDLERRIRLENRAQYCLSAHVHDSQNLSTPVLVRYRKWRGQKNRLDEKISKTWRAGDLARSPPGHPTAGQIPKGHAENTSPGQLTRSPAQLSSFVKIFKIKPIYLLKIKIYREYS